MERATKPMALGHEGAFTMLVPLAQGLGPLADPPALLVGLVVLALVILVGRAFLAIAWRLLLIAIIVLATLWILGILGFTVGVF